MKANISIYESIIRLFAGIVWAAIFGGWLTSWVGILAIYPIVTAMSGWCPLYTLWHKFTNEQNPYVKETKPKTPVEKTTYRMSA
jgi:hypothetical protein